jgi:16S rRNA (cytosine1402-N4)-methyltransferase
MLHFPVLLEESIDFLVHKNNGKYIDCTFGRGGHTQAILSKLTSSSHLTSFDKDLDAIKHASLIEKDNFKIIHDSFNQLENILKIHLSMEFFLILELAQLILMMKKEALALEIMAH